MIELARFDQRVTSQAAAAARPRLLFLGQTLPYPPDGGVNIRSYNILRLLARAFEITALCFFRRTARPSVASVRDSVEALREFGEVEAFQIPQEHSRFRFAFDHARSMVGNRAYTLYAYESRAFTRRLRELLTARHFDVVHLDSLDLAGYLPILEGHVVACTHQNVESSLLRRRSRYAAPGIMNRYLLHQARLTEREEAAWCGRVSTNLVVSSEDAVLLKRIAPAARVVVIPNGVNTSAFQPAGTDERGLVFVGGHDWLPNRDAMSFFADEILPLLRSDGTAVDMTWVGRAPPSIRDHYRRLHGITATGYVDDIRPHVQAAACYVVPLRTGGGTRLKILDAWAMGKAVVSTSVGCEGLAARDGENILIRDSAEEFADAVRTVLRDEQVRRRLGREARATVLQHYDWETIGSLLIEEYMGLLQTGAVE